MSFKSSWSILAVVLLGALLRLGAVSNLTKSPLCLHPVLEDADYQARSLAVRQGDWWGHELPRGSILYPIAIGRLPGLTEGGGNAVSRAQVWIEILTIALLMLWVRRRWGNGTAALAGLLYALDPLGAFFAARFSPVVLATCLFVGTLWIWDEERLRGGHRWPLAVLTAVLTTLGFLLTPLPFAALAILRAGDALRRLRGSEPALAPAPPPKKGMKPAHPTGRLERGAGALLPIALPALVALPLLLHHAHLPGGGPVLGWGGGPAANRAFDPGARGTPRYDSPPAWIPEAEWRAVAWESLQRRGDEYDLYRVYTRTGLGEALRRPFGTLAVLISKAAALTSARPVADELNPAFEFTRHARLFAPLLWVFPLLAGGALLGALLRRSDGTSATLLFGLAAVAIGALLGMSSAAARQPALPLLAALAAGGLTAALGRPAGRRGSATETPAPRRAAPLLFAAGALLLSLLTGWLGPARAQRDPAEDLRLSASAFTQVKAWRQAVPLLEEAVRIAPQNLEARVDLAEAYRYDALPAASTEQLEAAIAIDSTHARTLHALARDRGLNNRPTESLILLDRLVRAHPHRAEYVRELGDLWARAGNFPVAEQLLSHAVRLDPQDKTAAEALQQVVSIRLRAENSLFPEEIRMEEDSEYSAAIPKLVDALQAERWTAADSLLGWMERARPERATTWWMRAGYLARRGDRAGAIRALEQCQRISPGRPAVVTQLVRLYEETGRASDIAPLLESARAAVGADSAAAQQIRALQRALGR